MTAHERDQVEQPCFLPTYEPRRPVFLTRIRCAPAAALPYPITHSTAVLDMHPFGRTLALALLLAIAPSSSSAQDTTTEPRVPEVTSTAEATAVWASGNSDASTFGAAATSRIQWSRTELKVEAGGLRTESTLTTRTALGTETDFELRETTNRQRTAENYHARSRFDYSISERFLAFAGLDWLRNTFAGIESRFLIAAGAGNTWADNEQWRLKTDYGLTYTFQNDVVTNPFTNTSFPGIRAAYDFWLRVSSTTEFTSELVGDLNLDNTDDLRLNFVAALPVSISERLALKPSIQLLWRNDPALVEVPLFGAASTESIGSVRVPLQKLDTFFTLAVVVRL